MSPASVRFQVGRMSRYSARAAATTSSAMRNGGLSILRVRSQFRGGSSRMRSGSVRSAADASLFSAQFVDS